MLQTAKIEALSRSSFVEPTSHGYNSGYQTNQNGSGQLMADKPNGSSATTTAGAGNRELDQALVVRAQQGDKKPLACWWKNTTAS